MNKVLLFSLLIILLIIFYYLYNRFTLRENFYSKTTRHLRGKVRQMKREGFKYGEGVIDKTAKKIKSGLRKINF
jgi:hypothetical protein